MNSINKTLYISLYGKAYVSGKGLFIDDKKAEEIWLAEGFALKGKSKSKWLAYYMGIRAAVFDRWVREQTKNDEGTVVIHVGCGLDSRALRVGAHCKWYDVDFPEVISERKRYYSEKDGYIMIGGDVNESTWLDLIPETKHAVVVMEGVSMYLTQEQLRIFTQHLCNKFEQVSLLMDCYSLTAAKLSRYRNPVNDVGVSKVYGTDDPKYLQCGEFIFIKEHDITPQEYIDELEGTERRIFKKLYAGGFSRKLYRVFEYGKGENK